MKAAVVTSLHQPPRYQDFALPVPRDEDEMVIDVLASGLHPRVRSQADGSHYTSTDALPLVPGIDGVGRDTEGRLRYFILPDTTMGAMAEKTVIDARRSIVLPEGTDPVGVAAAMNPAMASWIALRQRAPLQAGQSVLILGATGNAGEMAVQIAKRLGAVTIVAAGRDASRLARLTAMGATEIVQLGAEKAAATRLGEAAADVDVVLDFVWGEATAAAMVAVVSGRADRGKAPTWIEIGSVSGPTAAIPSAALRAARLSIVGSGQGSVSTRDIVKELPQLAQVIASGELAIEARAIPLADVEAAWANRGRGRIVITPGR